MNKLGNFCIAAATLLLLCFVPGDIANASGGKSTVGITLQQEESTQSSEQTASTSETKTYDNSNDFFPKTGDQNQMQYILLGIGIIGLLCIEMKRRRCCDDKKL